MVLVHYFLPGFLEESGRTTMNKREIDRIVPTVDGRKTTLNEVDVGPREPQNGERECPACIEQEYIRQNCPLCDGTLVAQGIIRLRRIGVPGDGRSDLAVALEVGLRM